jgi:RNA polymerase sigma-70 factor (ECF subfamily)
MAARPTPDTTSARVVDASEDAAVLHALKNGDERALQTVFSAYYSGMCTVARRIVFAPDVAEELVQDVFFKLWKKRESLQIDSLKTYLYRAARNTALNHTRRQRLERAHAEKEGLKGEPTAVEATDDATVAKEVAVAVQRAVDRLPGRCREVFLMSRQDGMTYQQIADTLEISIKTVETQMGRALKSLRLSLAPFRG